MVTASVQIGLSCRSCSYSSRPSVGSSIEGSSQSLRKLSPPLYDLIFRSRGGRGGSRSPATRLLHHGYAWMRDVHESGYLLCRPLGAPSSEPLMAPAREAM